MRGQVGSLLQEREELRLRMKQLARNTQVLERRIKAQVDYIAFLGAENTELREAIEEYRNWAEGLAIATEVATALAESGVITAGAAKDCWMVAGLAVGSGCPGAAIGAALRVISFIAKWGALPTIRGAERYNAYQERVFLLEQSNEAELYGQTMALENLGLEAIILLSEYEQLTQLLFNLNVRINDTVFLAEQAAKHYHTQVDRAVDNIEDYLGGAAVGNVLVRNAYVTRANVRFHDLVVATYKMASAFVHSYNLEANRTTLFNKVFQLATPDDVRELVRELEVAEMEYCGASGIDCDAENNTSYLRVSLRDLLFFPRSFGTRRRPRARRSSPRASSFTPQSPGSGYLQTRERAGQTVRQIELPFAIDLNHRGAGSGPAAGWMLSPLE